MSGPKLMRWSVEQMEFVGNMQMFLIVSAHTKTSDGCTRTGKQDVSSDRKGVSGQ